MNQKGVTIFITLTMLYLLSFPFPKGRNYMLCVAETQTTYLRNAWCLCVSLKTLPKRLKRPYKEYEICYIYMRSTLLLLFFFFYKNRNIRLLDLPTGHTSKISKQSSCTRQPYNVVQERTNRRPINNIQRNKNPNSLNFQSFCFSFPVICLNRPTYLVKLMRHLGNICNSWNDYVQELQAEFLNKRTTGSLDVPRPVRTPGRSIFPKRHGSKGSGCSRPICRESQGRCSVRHKN